MAAFESPFLNQIETIADEVGTWAASQIQMILDTLMPDGVPYGGRKLTEREQVVFYMKNLRGNPQAWSQYLNSRVKDISDNLEQLYSKFQVDPASIAEIHPWDIVIRRAVAYSAKMEKLLGEYEMKTAIKIQQERAEELEEAATPGLLEADADTEFEEFD